MPLFAKPDGEGVYVPAKPRRRGADSDATKHARRLRIFRVWWDYRQSGMSYRDIAECTERPESTVRAGIQEFIAHLDLIRAERQSRPEVDLGSIVPAFGCTPYVPSQCDQKRGHCTHCANPIRFDSLMCPYCDGFSSAVEREIRRRAESERRRGEATEANRAAAGPPPKALTDRWDAIEAEQKAESEAKRPKARRRSKAAKAKGAARARRQTAAA